LSSVLQPRGSRFARLSALLRGDRPLLAMLRSAGTQALIVLMNMLTGIITARLLGPEGRGEYAAVSLWPPLLGMLATAGLGSAVIFRLRRYPEARGPVAGAALVLGVGYALVMIAVGALLLPWFMTRYSANTVLFAQACLITVAFNAVQIVMKQTFAGLGQYWYCNLTHLLPQTFHLLLLLGVMAVTVMTPRYAVLALFASSALAVLAMLSRFVRSARPRVAGALGELRALSSYSMRAAPTGLVSALLLFSDRLVLIPLLPPRELGFYAVAFSFSRVIQFVQPALQSIFLSHMSAQDAAVARRIHDEACRVLIAALVLGCGVLWIAGQWLLAFAYGPEFVAANAIFRILVLEASLSVLSQVTVQLFLSRDRPGLVSGIQGVMLLISFALLLTLVPIYGALGAAVALALAGALRWIVMLFAVRRVLGGPLPRLWLNATDLRALFTRLRR
jgi:O-antigen/teichoic acid export membrane protein